jgi:pimeloyl-ACP methyl ester carboxylesterase
MTHDPHASAVPVHIATEGMVLHGDLGMPAHAQGLVVFVHGSGSSRFSPRNRFVDAQFNKLALATLLVDLLTEEEHRIDVETMRYRFDTSLLGSRSTLAVTSAQRQPATGNLPIGLFGASTGAAAALITAAHMKRQISAVVSRAGRPDLAEEVLGKIEAPTLFIVGSEDQLVLELNEKAAAQMHCVHEIHVVLGATHLFEEPGTLEEVVAVAGQWLAGHMQRTAGEKRLRWG